MKIEELKIKYPNNYYLGEFIRQNYKKINNSSLEEIIKQTPNNFELGKKIRDL